MGGCPAEKRGENMKGFQPWIRVILTIGMVLSLAACGQSTQETWQEQYDLGVRYLSEGNYEEAILAFTAAIEIDPRRPEAFVGRGDAYMGTAELAAAEPAKLSDTARTAYERALEDYLTAVELDEQLAEVYSKLSDVYLALGDPEAAQEILQQGVGATEDAELLTQLTEMRGFGNRGSSSLWRWDAYKMYEGKRDQLLSTYQATEYNDAGFPVAGEIKGANDGETEQVRMEWDSLGQLISSSNGVYCYDAQGRILPDTMAEYVYDAQGVVTQAVMAYDDAEIRYTYDEKGRLLQTVIARNDGYTFTNVYQYDAHGRVTRMDDVLEIDAPDGEGYTEHLYYVYSYYD